MWLALQSQGHDRHLHHPRRVYELSLPGSYPSCSWQRGLRPTFSFFGLCFGWGCCNNLCTGCFGKLNRTRLYQHLECSAFTKSHWGMPPEDQKWTPLQSLGPKQSVQASTVSKPYSAFHAVSAAHGRCASLDQTKILWLANDAILVEHGVLSKCTINHLLKDPLKRQHCSLRTILVTLVEQCHDLITFFPLCHFGSDFDDFTGTIGAC